MTSRRTAACQYGSRAELAIIDALQLEPIEMSSPVTAVRPLWQAMHRSEVSKTEGVDGRLGATSSVRRPGAERAREP